MPYRISLAAICACLGLMLSSTPATAQQARDCGTVCHWCGIFGWEGRTWAANGDYDMTCYEQLPDCVACSHPEMVGDDTPAAARIIDVVKATSDVRLAAALKPYRDRLLWSPVRHLIVVQGNSCDAKALAAVVFVDPQKAGAIQRLGLRVLEKQVESLSSAAPHAPTGSGTSN